MCSAMHLKCLKGKKESCEMKSKVKHSFNFHLKGYFSLFCFHEHNLIFLCAFKSYPSLNSKNKKCEFVFRIKKNFYLYAKLKDKKKC